MTPTSQELYRQARRRRDRRIGALLMRLGAALARWFGVIRSRRSPRMARTTRMRRGEAR